MPKTVEEGVKVYGRHRVRERWTMYVGTVQEVNVQKDHTGHETRAAIVQWEDKDDCDNERLSYPEARLRVGPRGRGINLQGQLVPEHKVKELKGMEASFGEKE